MRVLKLNKFVSLIIAILLMIMPFATVSASVESLPQNIESTSYDLLTLKAPVGENLTTTNKVLPVSAVAPEGAVVTVYKYNPATDAYHKIYVNDAPVEVAVGATMLFATQLELSQGTNKFLLLSAKDEATYQVVKFEVKLLNEGFMDKIKSIAGMIFN